MNKPFNNRILLVEDTEDTAYLLKFYLEHQGYAVVVAKNGKQALEILAKDTDDLPAVILLDLMMPVMDGEKFLQIQRADVKLASIPVIIMSATNDIEREMQRLHATGYLKKTTSLENLLKTAEQYCH